MNICGLILKCAGWKIDITVPQLAKCVICVAPHTSNWDFIIGILAWHSMGRKANFLMKDFWFFFPLKYLLRALGGIPVPRKKKGAGSLTERMIGLFNNSNHLTLAVTPEGTRSATDNWRTGFLYIAHGADVPLLLGVIDYATKTVIIRDEMRVTGNVDHDLEKVKKYYAAFASAAKYPSKFKI